MKLQWHDRSEIPCRCSWILYEYYEWGEKGNLYQYGIRSGAVCNPLKILETVEQYKYITITRWACLDDLIEDREADA